MIHIKLSRMMGDRRISIRKLSEDTGIARTTLSAYYNDVRDRINLEHFNILCQYFGCDLSELLEYTKDGEEEPHPLQRPDVSRMAPPGVRRMVSNE